MSYSPWGRKESDTTEQFHFLFTVCSSPCLRSFPFHGECSEIRNYEVDISMFSSLLRSCGLSRYCHFPPGFGLFRFHYAFSCIPPSIWDQIPLI